MLFLRILGVVTAMTLVLVTAGYATEPVAAPASAVALAPASAPVVVPSAPSIAPGVDGGVAPAIPSEIVSGAAPASKAEIPVKTVVDVVEAAKDAIQGPTLLGIFAAVAAFARLLMELARRFGGRLLTQKQVNKAVILFSALAMGAASVVPGMSWWAAVFTGLSPMLLTLGQGDHPSKQG